MVTDFSTAEKVTGVKFCMLVRLLSGQVFSHFGDFRLAGSHGGALLRGCTHRRTGATRRLSARLGVQSELGRRRRV